MGEDIAQAWAATQKLSYALAPNTSVRKKGAPPPVLEGEFWTASQRQAHRLHEVSYRACFKPQLPRYFIERYSESGDLIYDAFSGRGTTALESALLGRRVVANDVNPLSRILAEPRLSPPRLEEVETRLHEIAYRVDAQADLDLSMFYHPRTESEIVSLKKYFSERRVSGAEDNVDRWIRMVATNRLTGHSPGFFSVFSFPPNQAVSAKSQIRINKRRRQIPEYRDTRQLLLRKSRQLLAGVDELSRGRLVASKPVFLQRDARSTSEIANGSVQLTVTSPPFLNIVHYAQDNWLRGWFNEIKVDEVAQSITMSKTIENWTATMRQVFRELFRITRPGGHVAFEVGEIRKATLRLDEHVIPLGTDAGFYCEFVLLNTQRFTKTAHIWGVSNNAGGTNTNRVVLFSKESMHR